MIVRIGKSERKERKDEKKGINASKSESKE